MPKSQKIERKLRDPEGSHVPMTPAMEMLQTLGQISRELERAREQVLKPRLEDLEELAWNENQKTRDIVRVQGRPERSTVPLYRNLGKRGYDTGSRNWRQGPIVPAELPEHLAKPPVGLAALRRALDKFIAENSIEPEEAIEDGDQKAS